jgi:hypothetical protein
MSVQPVGNLVDIAISYLIAPPGPAVQPVAQRSALPSSTRLAPRRRCVAIINAMGSAPGRARQGFQRVRRVP